VGVEGRKGLAIGKEGEGEEVDLTKNFAAMLNLEIL